MTSTRSGILWILTGLFFLTLMDALVKVLVLYSISPVQIIAVRSMIIIPVMVVIFFVRGQMSELKMNNPSVLLGRGLIGFFAPFCFFMALETLPLADTVVVFFSSVFMSTALSIPILKEKVGIHRWTAVALGFVGVVIAVQPEGGGEWIGYILVFISAFVYSILFLTGRKLANTETITALVFSFNFMAGLIGLAALPFVWRSMVATQWLLLIAIASVALLGHYCVTTAFSRAPVSVLAPFEYTTIIWATLLGFLLWEHIPSANVWLGCGIIVFCGLYVAYREAKVSHAKS